MSSHEIKKENCVNCNKKTHFNEDVYIEFGTNRSPCIIRPVENGDYIYMILPIKMKD